MDVTTEAAPSPHGTARRHVAVRLLMAAVVGGAAAVFGTVSHSHGVLSSYHLPWPMLVVLFYAGEASMCLANKICAPSAARCTDRASSRSRSMVTAPIAGSIQPP